MLKEEYDLLKKSFNDESIIANKIDTSTSNKHTLFYNITYYKDNIPLSILVKFVIDKTNDMYAYNVWKNFDEHEYSHVLRNWAHGSDFFSIFTTFVQIIDKYSLKYRDIENGLSEISETIFNELLYINQK